MKQLNDLTKEELFYVKSQYNGQRSMARGRNIDFLLTLDEWFSWWIATGHYENRGRKRGQYVMSRKNDQGPYALSNIECKTHCENISEAHTGRKKSVDEIAKQLATKKANGRVVSEETKRKLSESHKGKKQSAETIAKRVAKNTGQDRSAAWTKYYERKAANV